MFIDVHCHLTDENFQGEYAVERLVERAKERGVGALITCGYDLASSKRCKALAERFDEVYFCAGFQPEELNGCMQDDLEKLKELLGHEKCVAVGEIGLDYHFEDNPPKEKQKEFFQKQIDLAALAGLPIVVHSRDACLDTLEVLRANREKLSHGGLMHCYSYSRETVADFAALGMYFSFGGTSTFKNAKKVKESAQAVGNDRILSETDCPYLSPEPLRGRFPNLPENVVYTVEHLAALRQTTVERLAGEIEENAKRLFFKWKR